jgi:hypothetical protein
MAVPPSPQPWQFHRWPPRRWVNTLRGGVRPVWRWPGVGARLEPAAARPGPEEGVGEGFEVDAVQDLVSVTQRLPSLRVRRRRACADRRRRVAARWRRGGTGRRRVGRRAATGRGPGEGPDPGAFGVGQPEGALADLELLGVLAEHDLGVGLRSSSAQPSEFNLRSRRRLRSGGEAGRSARLRRVRSVTPTAAPVNDSAARAHCWREPVGELLRRGVPAGTGEHRHEDGDPERHAELAKGAVDP